MKPLEQRIKFDHGLTIGTHCVTFTHAGREVRALVEITQRGKVNVMTQPDDGDMYTSWCRLDGDRFTGKRDAVIVWAARCPEFRAKYAALFSAEPVAAIPCEA